MTDYLAVTHQPGQDGILVGAPGQQGLLYSWMRVLAGGGVSEFSGIRMRGDLIDKFGTVITGGDFDPSANEVITGKWSFTGDCSDIIVAPGEVAISSTGDRVLLEADNDVVISSTGANVIIEAGDKVQINVGTSKTIEFLTNTVARLTVSDTNLATSLLYFPNTAQSLLNVAYVQLWNAGLYDAVDQSSFVYTLPATPPGPPIDIGPPTAAAPGAVRYSNSTPRWIPGIANTLDFGVYQFIRACKIRVRVELDIVAGNVAGLDIVLSVGLDGVLNPIQPSTLYRDSSGGSDDYKQLSGTWVLDVTVGQTFRAYLGCATSVPARVACARYDLQVVALT